MWTDPVPASNVTCSPKIIGDFLSTRGCFVFNNSKARISKISKTTYGEWCERNGFKYADKVIPQSWIEEIKLLNKEN